MTTGGQTTLNDVAGKPSDVADSPSIVRAKLPADIYDLYEIYSYRNAAVILAESRKNELDDIMEALRKFALTTEMIRKPGGNES